MKVNSTMCHLPSNTSPIDPPFAILQYYAWSYKLKFQEFSDYNAHVTPHFHAANNNSKLIMSLYRFLDYYTLILPYKYIIYIYKIQLVKITCLTFQKI